MSRSSTAVPQRPGTDTETQDRFTDPEAVQTIVEGFDDPDCRAILAATREEWLTVGEIADRCDLAQSTAYRKVDLLVEAELLSQSACIRPSGTHVSTYGCDVADVTLSIDDEGVELRLDRDERESSPTVRAPASAD